MVNLVNIREEANRPIPGPEGWGGGREAPSIPAPRRRTPIPTPRRNVRQLIQYFEANPILPLIGLFRLPLRETATTTEYQPLGQELMKNDGL